MGTIEPAPDMEPGLDLGQPPSVRKVIIAGNNAGDLVRSRDGGFTWEVLPRATPASAVIVSVTGSDTGVWIVTARVGSTTYYVFRSADHGDTWSEVLGLTTLPGLLTSSPRYSHATTDDKGGWLLLGASTILKSADDGVTWAVAHALTGFTAPAATTDGAGKWMVLGKTYSVLCSADDGVTWEVKASPVQYMTAVATDNLGKWVVVGSGGAALVTEDFGDTWVSANFSVSTSNIYDVAYARGRWIVCAASSKLRTTNNLSTGFDVKPSDISAPVKLASQGGMVIAAASSGKIAFDETAGIAFASITLPAAASLLDVDIANDFSEALPSSVRPVILYREDVEPLYRSVDRGRTWVGIPLLDGGVPISVRDVASSPDGTWLAFGQLGGYGRLARSADNGQSWVVSELAGASTHRSLVTNGRGTWMANYAQTGEVSLLISLDNGVTWSPSTFVLANPAAKASALLTDQRGVWLLYGTNGTLLRSEDNGENWSPVSTPVTGSFYGGVGDYDGLWLLGSDQGLIRSLDRGLTWTLLVDPALSGAVRGVTRVGGSRWLVRSQSGFAVSSDDGDTWELKAAASTALTISTSPLYAYGDKTGFLFSPANRTPSVYEPRVSFDGGDSWGRIDTPPGPVHYTSGVPAQRAVFGSALSGDPDPDPDPDPDTLPEDPASPKVWVAVGHLNGYLRIARSADGGATWFSPNIAPTEGELYAVASDDQGRWIATGTQFLRSINNGRTWAAIALPSGVEGALGAIAAGDDGVWVAGGPFGTVLRSGDHGQTWRTVDLSGVTPVGWSVTSIATDGAGHWIATLRGLGSVLVSSDNGLSWVDVYVAGLNTVGSQGLQAVDTDRLGGWVVVGDVSNAMFYSADNGLTWVPRPTPYGSAALNMAYGVATSRNGVWVATWEIQDLLRSTDEFLSHTYNGSTPGQLGKVRTDRAGAWLATTVVTGYVPTDLGSSADDGVTWASISTGVPISSVRDVQYGTYNTEPVIDPPPDEEPEPEPEPDPIYWFAVGGSGKVRRSTDNGLVWSACAANFEETDEVYAAAADGAGAVIVAGDGGQMRRSADNGALWTTVDAGFGVSPIRAVAAGHNGAWIAVGGDGKISRSVDNGETWALLPNSLGLIDTLLCVATNREGIWIAGDEYGTLIRSIDNGVTWAEVPSGVTGQISVVMSLGAGRWLAAGINGKVLRSVDAGASWSEVAATGAFYLGGAAREDVVMLVGWNGEVARSLDAGLTWAFVGAYVGTTWMLSAASSPDGRWLLGGQSGVMALTPDNGGSWASAGPGITPDSINAIAFGSGALTPGGSDMNIESTALGDDALTFRSRVFVESLGSTADALTFGGSVLLEMLSSLRSSVSVDFTTTLLVNMHDLIEVQADQTVASVIGVTILSKLYAHGLPDTETPSEVWVLNAETMGATRYEGFEFNSYAKIGNSYYGCAADGLYLLEGDTDAGDPVRAMVSFGKQDFGTTTLKRISNAYIGLRSDGKLFLKVTAEGSDYLYAARDYDEHRKVQRFDIGKGLCANYIEFELYNEDGDDFELASVEFAAVPVSRRI